MRLYRYIDRILSILYSRRDFEIVGLDAEISSEDEGSISGRIQYWDGAFMDFREELIWEFTSIVKEDYSYHYQKGDTLIFRYDNAPHHPEILTFPHHKHTSTGEVIPAAEPHIREILREIDSILEVRSSRS